MKPINDMSPIKSNYYFGSSCQKEVECFFLARFKASRSTSPITYLFFLLFFFFIYFFYYLFFYLFFLLLLLFFFY